MRVSIVLLTAFLLATAQPAFACADPDEPSFTHQLAGAKSVFVFRLLSLSLASRSPGYPEIVGKIEIVRTLKGQPSFQQITYTDLPCGGLRPRVGHHFLVATRKTGNSLHFVRGDNSVIDISSDYAMTYPPPPEKSKYQWHIANYLRGVPLPARFAERVTWLNIYDAPPPPPPPPGKRP